MYKVFTFLISCLSLLGIQVALAQHQQQQQQYTTPVPILKQIDRHNDDGSYTYGYEAADKSFKIETKYPNGEVYGKYGYVDDQGKVREVEYGASKRGFEPAGSHINVPPPTLTNSNPYPLGANELDDGQYREDPAVYFKDQKYNRPIAASKFSLNNFPQQQRPQYAPQLAPQHAPQPQQHYNPAPPQQKQYYNHASQPPHPQYQQQYQPQYQAPTPQPRYQQPSAYQQPYYHPQPQPQPQHYQAQPQYNNNHYNPIPQQHHPAVKNFDIWSGSYSIDYTGRRK